jgi:hypothetical protein
MLSDLDTYLTTRLAQAANRDDLILEICQKTGAGWEDAEARLRVLEETRQALIQRRQVPYLFILSLGAFTGGLALGYAYYLDLSNAVFGLLGRHPGLGDLLRFTVASTYNLPLLIGGITLAAGGAGGILNALRKRSPTP